jgi:hypothetical protein
MRDLEATRSTCERYETSHRSAMTLSPAISRCNYCSPSVVPYATREDSLRLVRSKGTKPHAECFSTLVISYSSSNAFSPACGGRIL